MGQTLWQVQGRFGHIACVDPVTIEPTVVHLGNATDGCAKELGQFLDFISHLGGVVDWDFVFRNGDIGGNCRLKAFTPTHVCAAVRDDVGYKPTGIAQGKVFLRKAVAATRCCLHPIRREKGICFRAANSVVPKRPCENVIALAEPLKVIRDVYTRGRVAWARVGKGRMRSHAERLVVKRRQSNVSVANGKDLHVLPAQASCDQEEHFMTVGFIGLGAVGAKLAGSLLRNDVSLIVLDLDPDRMSDFVTRGATAGTSAAQMMRECEVVITSLPSPAASEAVLSDMLPEMGPGKTWIEMSTTDPQQIMTQAVRVERTGGALAECPVSGGCHRAATGNIAIFAGCPRPVFDAVLPLLTHLGRQILHTGEVGTASTLKVMTNYLATVHLVALCEAMTVMKSAGLDLATTYDAIRISSGNSFVHETESQLILSGNRDVDFTLDLVKKDVGLFQALADQGQVPLEISPMILDIIADGQSRFGDRAQSDRLIERLEEATGLPILASGFPTELVDEEPEGQGQEFVVRR